MHFGTGSRCSSFEVVATVEMNSTVGAIEPKEVVSELPMPAAVLILVGWPYCLAASRL